MTGEYLSTNRVDLKQPATLFMVASALAVIGLGVSFHNTTAGIHAFGYSLVFMLAGTLVMFKSGSNDPADFDRPKPPVDVREPNEE